MSHNAKISNVRVPNATQTVGSPFNVTAHFDFIAGGPPLFREPGCMIEKAAGTQTGEKYEVGVEVRDGAGNVIGSDSQRECIFYGYGNTGRDVTFSVTPQEAGDVVVQFFMEQVTNVPEGHERYVSDPVGVSVETASGTPGDGDNPDGIDVGPGDGDGDGGNGSGANFLTFATENPLLAGVGSIAAIVAVREGANTLIGGE